MNNMPTVDDLKQYKSAGSFYMPMKQLVLWCGLILGLMFTLGLMVSHILTSERYDLVMQNVHSRLEVRAYAKADLLKSWLRGIDQTSRNITESETFRLYATEASLLDDGERKELSKSVSAQKPYLEKALAEYAQRYNLMQAALIGHAGKMFLTATDGLVLTHDQKKLIDVAIICGDVQVAPLNVDDGSMLLMHIKPVFAMGDDDKPKAAAAFVSIINVSADITHYLSEGPLSLAGERTRLLQKRTGMMEYLDMTRSMPALFKIKPELIDSLYVSDRVYPKDKAYDSPLDQETVFGVAHPVVDTPFILLQEYDKQAALAYYYSYRNSVYLVMVLLVLAIAASLSALLVYVMSTRNRIRVTHQQQMLNALVRAVEIRDPYLSGHHERMARMSLRVANMMRLTIPERSTLYYSAMLSSVGKIFIPQKILSKPGELTAKEREILEAHVGHAEKVLIDIDFDLPVSEVIHQMYERMDGSGYPEKLNGSQISLLSRILAVCDVYCALTRPRSYREALSVEDALDILEKESAKFDKGVAGIVRHIVQGQNEE